MLTCPSGATVRYARNTQGQIVGVYARPTASAAEVVIADTIGYLPFGPLGSLRFGNGRTLTKTYDRNYAIDRIEDNATDGIALDFTPDIAGNIVGLSEQLDGTTVTRAVDYDGQNRLTALREGATTVQGFGYDATGNRTSATRAGTSTSYTYASGTHRLQSVGTAARDYDAAGNTTAIAPHTLSYDERGRLSEVRENGALKMRYRYNGRGERVAKLHPSDASRNRWFVYADDGRLLGEYDNEGERIAEYVWLDDTLIAVLSEHDGSGYQFVETDHLGTPRVIVHPARDIAVWRWDLSETAFGEHAAQDDPDADGVGYVFNLRYPGQYFDAEWGLHHNYFRDYEPGSGRYVESDPIGLGGGVGTYVYVENGPLDDTDPLGLAKNKNRTTAHPCQAKDNQYCADYCGSRGVMRCVVYRTWVTKRIARTRTGVPLEGKAVIEKTACECGDNQNFCERNPGTCITVGAVLFTGLLLTPIPGDEAVGASICGAGARAALAL